MKPSEFFVGIVDFFAALLPGAIATWLALQYIDPADLRRWGGVAEGSSEIVRGAAFFLTSYILGHFIYLGGAQLDPWYDRWRQREHPHGTDPNFQAAKKLRDRISGELPKSGVRGAYTTLRWARAYITIHAPNAILEIDQLEANSKFFRSLVVMFALIAAHFLLHEQRPGLAAASASLSVLSHWRYRDQRWKLTELSFATAVLVHCTKVAVGAAHVAVSEQRQHTD